MNQKIIFQEMKICWSSLFKPLDCNNILNNKISQSQENSVRFRLYKALNYLIFNGKSCYTTYRLYKV